MEHPGHTRRLARAGLLFELNVPCNSAGRPQGRIALSGGSKARAKKAQEKNQFLQSHETWYLNTFILNSLISLIYFTTILFFCTHALIHTHKAHSLMRQTHGSMRHGTIRYSCD
jgi:hypothetical protein